MDRRVTPLKWVNSPSWAPPPPWGEQALKLYALNAFVIMLVCNAIRWSEFFPFCFKNTWSQVMARHCKKGDSAWSLMAGLSRQWTHLSYIEKTTIYLILIWLCFNYAAFIRCFLCVSVGQVVCQVCSWDMGYRVTQPSPLAFSARSILD